MGAFALPVTGNLIQAAVPAATSGAAVGTSVALLSNPVTAIAGIALSLGTFIKSIFGAHHAQAVQTEAQALNSAVPAVEKSIAATFQYLNAGQVTPAQATSALDTLIPSYNDAVYKQFGVKQKSGNGPDVVLKDWLLPDVTNAEALINSGKPGSFELAAIPAHAGFAGAPSMQISWNAPLSGANPTGTGIAAAIDEATSAIASKVAPAMRETTASKTAVAGTSLTTILFWVLGIILFLKLVR